MPKRYMVRKVARCWWRGERPYPCGKPALHQASSGGIVRWYCDYHFEMYRESNAFKVTATSRKGPLPR